MRLTTKAGKKNLAQVTEDQLTEDQQAREEAAAELMPKVGEPVTIKEVEKSAGVASQGPMVDGLEYSCRRELAAIAEALKQDSDAMVRAEMEVSGLGFADAAVSICNKANFPPDSWRGRYNR